MTIYYQPIYEIYCSKKRMKKLLFAIQPIQPQTAPPLFPDFFGSRAMTNRNQVLTLHNSNIFNNLNNFQSTNCSIQK